MPAEAAAPTALAADPLVAGNFYLAAGGRLYLLEGTSRWLDITGDLPSLTVYSLAFDYASPPSLLLGTSDGLWVRRPLYAAPSSLLFMKEPADLSRSAAAVNLSPSGGVTATLAWEAVVTPTVSWLSVGPASGTSLPVTLTLSVNAAGLPAGNHDAAVLVRLTNAPFSPATELPVRLYIGPVRRSFVPWIGGVPLAGEDWPGKRPGGRFLGLLTPMLLC